jgi:mono/diheme cytochrome c family protein
MRLLLKAVSGVEGALSEDSLPKAAEAASSAGMAMAVDVNTVLMAKLPLEFKELGMGTHKAFDDLAADIRKGARAPSVLKSLSQITQKCIACHEVNRFAQP